MKSINKIWSSKFWWLFLLIIVVAINFLASSFHSRLDLTKEKRYTLSKASMQLLNDLNDHVSIDVFIEKESLPSEVKQLKNSINEFLLYCKEYSKNNLEFRFVNPYQGLTPYKTGWKIRCNIFTTSPHLFLMLLMKLAINWK
jgi:ABC-2 type transport system permease protein